MYAAGHPPLAGFEIESFIDKMPRHWRYSNELTTGDHTTAPIEPALQTPSFDRTRNMLIGSVVALRMAVELAVADATMPGDKVRWPELARLDCFACHHELAEPGWRQFRSVSAAAPGRPQLALGCVPLVSVAAQTAGGAEADVEIGLMLARLTEPFKTNVFGDPQLLQANGQAVADSCQALEQQLAAMDFRGEAGRNAARTILRAIAEQAAAEHRDYDTARQLFGAWRIVYEELKAAGGITLPDANQSQLDELLRRIDERDVFALERERIKPPCEAPPQSDSAAAPENELSTKATTNRVNYNPASFARLMTRLNARTAE
jgi:hypothetical protein